MSKKEIKANQDETDKILTKLEEKQSKRTNKINDLLESEKEEEDFEL
jgi:hypothetical protein